MIENSTINHPSEENTRHSCGRWSAVTLGLIVAALLIFASVTIYIDPLFHYHKPLENYAYPISDERYQNDGITKHFEYDGVITGTSMTQNFKTSEAEKLFGGSFIKVPFEGGFFKEINDNLKRGFAAGNQIKYVIRGLDYDRLVYDKDYMRTDAEYPVYLYNNNPFDDINYILNKSVFLDQTINVLSYTKAGNQTTTFNAYNNWNARVVFGDEAVLSSYSLGQASETTSVLSDDDRRTIRENIRQNVTDLADEHPETTFYLFFTPYSICYWDFQQHYGLMERQFEIEQVAIEGLLDHPNIKLFCFYTNFDMVCDLNNYKDNRHYGEWINSWMLEQIHNENYLLTEDNYLAHLDAMRTFYRAYDYNALHN